MADNNIGNLTNDVNDLTSATVGATTATTQLVEAQGNATTSADTQAASTNSLSGAVKTLDEFSGGLLTTLRTLSKNPLLMTLTALVGIFQLFKTAMNSSEEGAAKFAAVGAGLTQVWDRFIKVLSDFLMPVMDWVIENFGVLSAAAGLFAKQVKVLLIPIDLLIVSLKTAWSLAKALALSLKGDFAGAGEAIHDITKETEAFNKRVVNKVKGLGVAVIETSKVMFDTTKKGINSVLKSSMNAAVKLTLQQKELVKSKREQERLDSEIAIQSSKQLVLFEKAGASIEDRRIALKEYIKLENQRSKNAVDQLNAEIANTEARMALRNNDAEVEQELNDLYIERNNLQEELNGKTESYNGNIKSLFDEEKALSESIRDSIRASADAATQAILDLQEESLEKTISIQEAAHKAILEDIEIRETEALRITGDNEEKAQEIRDKFNEERANADKANNAIIEKETKDHIKELEELFEDFNSKYLLLGSERLVMERDAELEMLEKRLGDHEQFEQMKAAITQQYADQIRVARLEEQTLSKLLNSEELAATMESLGTMQEAWETFGQARLDEETNKLDELVIARDTAARLGNAAEVARLDKDIKNQEKAIKKAEKMQQKAAIAGVIIDTASAIMGTWAGYASMGPYGAVIAAIQSAALVGLGAAQIAAIKSSSASQASQASGGTAAVSIPDIINQPPSVDTGIEQSIRAYIVEDDIATAQENVTSRNSVGQV